MKKLMERSMLPWLGKTMKMADYYIQDQMKAKGVELTKQQWLLLKVLNDEDGRPQNDLAFITNRDKGSLARLLNTMEGRNLVARIPSKTDRRVNHIYITKHGKNVLNDSAPLFEQIVEKLEIGITKEEKEVVICALKKIIENIKPAEIVAVETKN